MTHGRQARTSRPNRSGTVKAEPGLNGSATIAPSAPSNAASTSSQHDQTSRAISVDQSFILRGDRSNAPPPSSDRTDRNTESERPLFKEMRIRPAVPVSSPPNVEESFLNNSFRDIGKELKACNDTLGELQQLGVSHKVKLPELVLVGDQSAGKSTLMSGLANLELPRSEGTCTRCPLHIRVSRRSEWSCKVSLRREYTYRPPEDRDIMESDVTDEDPFFPWKKLPTTTVVEFKTMSDQSQIEDVLRWAQVAILNDNQSSDLFIPGSGPIATNQSIDLVAASTLAKFSPNIVALEIMGPDLPDLSFYDMPGVFQNPADARDDYLVSVVRNLSAEYINHPSAIILCGVAMNNDAENSCTMNLVRRLCASDRTIGVLTKADLLASAGHDQWLNIMRGDNHRTGLGYFITSRPPDMDLERLMKYEETFFDFQRSEKWPESFKPFANRCGIEKLKASLSERLAQEFAKSLPKIKKTISQLLDNTTRQLGNLPEMPNNVEKEISVSLRSFDDRARTRIDNFSKCFNEVPNNFRDCLIHMKPKFVLRDSSDAPSIVISDDDSDGVSVASAVTPSKRRTNGHSHVLAKRARPDTQSSNTSSSFNMSNGRGNFPVKPEEDQVHAPPPAPPSPVKRLGLPAPFTKYTGFGSGFRTLAQVREEKVAKTKAGMPDRLLDEMYEDLATAAISPWINPAEDFLTYTMGQLQKELDDVTSDSFSNLKKRLVFQEVRKHLRACLIEHSSVAKEQIRLLYEDESSGILTFNNEAFSQYEAEELAILTHFRHFQRMQHHAPISGPFLQWNELNDDKRAQALKRRDTDIARIGPDVFKEEIGVIGYVRAYYKLAALRFADSVSQIIIRRLIPGIKQHLSWFIDEKLGLRVENPQAVYERLMEEDARIATKRQELKSEREKFIKALQSIQKLESGVGGEGLSDHEDHDTEMDDIHGSEV